MGSSCGAMLLTLLSGFFMRVQVVERNKKSEIGELTEESFLFGRLYEV